VLITAALGIQFAGRLMAKWLAKVSWGAGIRHYVPAALAVVAISCSVIDAVEATPNFRLFTNSLGGGVARAGNYFPHDEFYDASMRDTIVEIGRRAKNGARVASESPLLASYYAQRDGRPDLVCVSLSDPEGLKQLAVGDYVIVARGRRYFSNDALIMSLASNAKPYFQMSLKTVHSVDVYVIDETLLKVIQTHGPQASSPASIKIKN
jgi:hypothetical protein